MLDDGLFHCQMNENYVPVLVWTLGGGGFYEEGDSLTKHKKPDHLGGFRELSYKYALNFFFLL